MTDSKMKMTAKDIQEKSENTEADQNEPEEPARTPTPTDINIALRCVMRNDVERFTRCFEDDEDQFKELIAEQMNERNEEFKTPLDMAAILGREEMVKELIERGAEVNSKAQKGYTALHHATAWGRIDCVKQLVEAGGDLQARTSHGQRAREVALRYTQAECVDYLDWAEAKQHFVQTVTGLQELMADPEKAQGKLDRNEKNSTLALVKEKLEWVETSAAESTTQELICQRETFEETVAPIIQKINEPSPKELQKNQKKNN